MKKAVIVFVFLIFSFKLFSQAGNISLYNEYYNDYLRYLDTTGKVHTAIRPLIFDEQLMKMAEQLPLFSTFSEKDKRWKVVNNSRLTWETNPIITAGVNLSDENFGNRTTVGIGLGQKVTVVKNISLFADFQMVNGGFDSLHTAFMDSSRIVPGMGSFFSASGSRRAFLKSRGGISWKTASWFHLFAGYDKVFLGDGYRSLFLSDNSIPFWQVRATVVTRHISYIMLYSFLNDDDSDIPGISYRSKFASTHYLNWNIGKRLQLNVFESVVWRGEDSLSKRGFDVNYISPIVFFRPVEFNLGSPDNMLLGMGGRFRLFKHLHLYGQLVLDEFKLSEVKAQTGWWANKFGMQAGLRAIFTMKENRVLLIQAEANGVRPFTFTHWNSLENYGNNLQPLAHPLGANFFEWITTGKYLVKRMTYEVNIKYAEWGTDSAGVNMGHNIYQSYRDSRKDYGNTWLQGEKHSRLMAEAKVSRIMNLQWNMKIELGLRYNCYTCPGLKVNEVLVTGGIVTCF